MVTREEFYVDSVDGIHMIHGFRWYNTDKAYKGVIQVVHGMLEYIERYDEFAKAMAENGYFVIGHDHLGHGDSVKDSEELGYVGEQGAVLASGYGTDPAYGSLLCTEGSLYYAGTQHGILSGAQISDLSWQPGRWSSDYGDWPAESAAGEDRASCHIS